MPTREELEEAGIDGERFVSREIDWYDGSIRGMDAETDRIFEKLRVLGLEERTLVAIVSDHGEEFLEHGRHFNGYHLYTTEPLLLAYWARKSSPQRRRVSRRFLSQVAFPLLKQGIKRLILGSDSAVPSKKED